MDHIYSISQLNNFVKDVLQSGFPAPVWVTGELQNYDRSKTRRHVFFELVEKDSESKDVKARIGLVIFEGRKSYIHSRLKQAENAFELKDDIEVKFLCKVDFYAPHGAVRLIIEDIDPVYTLGKIAQDRQKLIAQLKASGVLEKNKQLELPLVPLRIGLITAHDSAAYNDFCDEIKLSGLGYSIVVADAVMQGKNCEASVCRSLKKLANIISQLDVVVITRGGGSIADLSAFDSKKIAEAIAQYPVPVITGIGHEINTSVTDLAAHTFCKTPTAVAQFLTERIEAYIEQIDRLSVRLQEGLEETYKVQRSNLQNLAYNLRSFTQSYFAGHNQIIAKYEQKLAQITQNSVKNSKNSLNDLYIRLDRSISLRFEQAQSKIDNSLKLVQMADPVKILKRGFSITRNSSGKAISSIKNFKKDDELTIQVVDGLIQTQVQSVSREK